jgi:4-hydroxy-tetrahydrodipicolinate synthase
VLSGDDSITFPMIALGGDGLISVASNEAPELMARMVELALAGQWDEARELHYRLLPLMEVNFIESSPGPVKAGLAMMNVIGENYRLPIVPIAENSRAALRAVLIELGLVKEASHATT